MGETGVKLIKESNKMDFIKLIYRFEDGERIISVWLYCLQGI